jgi:hypothetical protein
MYWGLFHTIKKVPTMLRYSDVVVQQWAVSYRVALLWLSDRSVADDLTCFSEEFPFLSLLRTRFLTSNPLLLWVVVEYI